MFCGAVHICPAYSDSENATLRATALKSAAESTTIWLTPAFSVYTCAWRACSSSQRPLAVLPVKSTIFTSGRSASVCAVVSPAPCATSVTTFGSKPASASTSRAIFTDKRERQDRARMRLDDDGVAGREAREDPRVAVPRRKGAAADDETHAARHDAKVLAHPDRLVLALRLLPLRLGRHAAHLVPCVRDCFEPAILRVRAARLERHHERLAGRVHDRAGHHEALLVDAIENLQTDADPRFGSGLAPLRVRLVDGREQGVEIGARVGHAERHAEWRLLGADLARRRRLGQCKRLAEQRVERGLAGLGRAFAVVARARRLGIRRPVATLGDRGERAVERRAVLVEQGMGHTDLYWIRV